MKRALTLIATVLLLAPAGAAAATTYTVEPGGSIGAALAQATDGDTIHVRPGTYAEQPLTVAHAVRIEGEPGASVTTATGDPSKAVFTVTHDGVTITGLSIAAAPGGGRVVLSQAADLVLDGDILTRAAGPADTPVVEVDATPTTGTTTIAQSIVVNATGGSGHTSPAISGGPANSLAVSDSLVVSGAGEGPALRFTGGTANTLTRSVAETVAAGSDAVQAQCTTAGDKLLTIDSSVLSGGGSAASLRATNTKDLLVLSTGNLTVRMVHATLAGAPAAIATAVASTGVGTVGTVSVGADRSILRGSIAGGVAVTNSDTSAADVFVAAAAKNFHLRADAPVIDQGGPAAAGESDRDVDGQPRVVGAASDLGADEFVNQAPVARLATPPAGRTPGAMTFDASSSADPEAGAGGGIATYHFAFGDGATADSATPSVSHAYAKPGTYAATVTVTDAQGLAGATSDPVQAVVTDGVAPTARIIAPRDGRRIALRTRRGRLAPIRFTGSAADDVGVAATRLTLRRIGTKQTRTFTVRVAQGLWSYRVPARLKLRRGRYELKAYAIDAAGNVSAPARARFTLK